MREAHTHTLTQTQTRSHFVPGAPASPGVLPFFPPEVAVAPNAHHVVIYSFDGSKFTETDRLTEVRRPCP